MTARDVTIFFHELGIAEETLEGGGSLSNNRKTSTFGTQTYKDVTEMKRCQLTVPSARPMRSTWEPGGSLVSRKLSVASTFSLNWAGVVICASVSTCPLQWVDQVRKAGLKGQRQCGSGSVSVRAVSVTRGSMTKGQRQCGSGSVSVRAVSVTRGSMAKGQRQCGSGSVSVRAPRVTRGSMNKKRKKTPMPDPRMRMHAVAGSPSAFVLGWGEQGGGGAPETLCY